jgi:hypothetical protein
MSISCKDREFDMSAKYRIHRFDLKLSPTRAIWRNSWTGWKARSSPSCVDFLLIVEKLT